MKGKTAAAALLFLAAGTAAAQDRIVRADSTVVEARVEIVTPDEVRYRRFSNPDGPLYILPVTRIRAIRYANGEVELFGGAETTADPEVAEEYVARIYEVGEWYDRAGVRGIVCLVEADGRHGLVLSPDEATLSWGRPAESGSSFPGGSAYADGIANMREVERRIGKLGLSWADFPALSWCRAKGEGWYLPSVDEWLRIGAAYHGGTRAVNRPRERARFNETLRRNGGERMDRLAYYLTSTGTEDGRLRVTHLGLMPPYVDAVPCDDRCRVRAVHRF